MIRSEIPRTAFSSTSSASAKASCDRGVLAGQREQALVRDGDQRVDHPLQLVEAVLRMPGMRTRPSKGKGLVTTPTVSAPISRPPRRRSAPRRCRCRRPCRPSRRPCPSLRAARGAVRAPRAPSRGPVRGSAPQPRPRVISAPSCTLIGAWLCSSAWASVLAATNSTPAETARIMVLSALPPPPPTPITLIVARWAPASRIRAAPGRPPDRPRADRQIPCSRAQLGALRTPPIRGLRFLAISHPPGSMRCFSAM